MITNSRGLLQIPCTEKKHAQSKQKQNKQTNKIYKAIGLTSSIWKKEGGDLNVTFGSYKYPNEPNVSPFGAWSYVGSQTNNAMPGMNLGFIDPPYESFEYNGKTYSPEVYATRNYCRVDGSCSAGWTPGTTVVHEFCHALGMLHEHQNNLNNMNTLKASLDNDSVIKYYCELDSVNDPNCLNTSSAIYKNAVETANANVLDYYENKEIQETTYVGTNYDPNSIMHYALPDEWFKKGPGFKNPTTPIFVLSHDDIEWLKQRYPLGDPSVYPTITVKFIDTFDSGAKEAFKADITSKYNDYCNNHIKNEYCDEISKIYNNLNTYANDKTRWGKENAWKKAWVQKTVLDTFTHLIGVNFVFKENNNTVIQNTIDIEQTDTPIITADTGTLDNAGTKPVVKNITDNYKQLEIVSGVFGAMIGISLLIGLVAIIYKSVIPRHSGTYFTFKNSIKCNI